jgi:signal transduction histidine kinase
MSLLDPRSVIVMSAFLALVTLLILISLRRSVSAQVKGLGEWIVADLGFLLAVVLLNLRGMVHPFWGVVVANTLIVMAVLLFGHGLRRFYGEQPPLRPLVLTGAAFFAAVAFVNFVLQSYPLRLALVTTSLLGAFVFALWHLSRHVAGTFGERVTQLALALPAVGIMVRLVTVGEVGSQSQLFQSSPVQSFYIASLGGGVLSAGVGFILMVNERTRTELEKLARSLERTTHELRQQNEVKSKFLAYAGHDIRQPLQAMHLLLASLLESGLNAAQEKTARMMELSVNALTDLLNSLLDISKLEAGAIQPNLRPVELDVVLARLVQEFMPQARAKGLHLRLRLPRQTPLVQTDEQLLASVLRNLLGNAIKYTQRGGVLVALRRSASGWKLQVWDTGIGIAEEHLAHVFEEYYQVDNPQRDRSKGLGLGLAIVHRMAALLELQLACRSRLGQGTVMEITLAAADGLRPGDVDAGATASQIRLQGARVVVVEDDAAVAQALGQWLQAQGAAVVHYPSAEDALAAPDIASADIYLSDFRLPGRLTGIDFLETLRSRAQGDIPGVLLTGDTSSQFIEQVAASGWLILFKPVHPRDLQAVLKLLRTPAV